MTKQTQKELNEKYDKLNELVRDLSEEKKKLFRETLSEIVELEIELESYSGA